MTKSFHEAGQRLICKPQVAQMNDFRYAVRQSLKNPGFTAVAVLTLALGIGVNSLMFSAVNAVLLRPPPYKHPQQLVWLFASNPRLGYQRLPPNWANDTFSDLLEKTRSFEQSARIRAKEFILQTRDRPEPARGMRVSANLFKLLGIEPVLGRTFLAEENEWGRHRVVMLSYECWQRRFGGDPKILNQPIDLIDPELSDWNGKPHDTLDLQRYTVIGILPPGWRFPTGAIPEGDVGGFGGGAEIWQTESLNPDEKQRRVVLDNIIARLKPGVTWPQAEAEVQTLFRRLRQPFERTDPGYSVELMPLARQVTGNARTGLLLLTAATGFVLLIGCANIANLVLARASARRKEFAIRAALGARRARVMRQLFTESTLLSLVGGIFGFLLAWWGTHILARLSPAHLPRVDEIQLDAGVLAFTFGLSMLTSLAFGFAPAWQASKADVNDALTESNRGSSSGFRSHRMRGLLVVSEVALSLVLLFGAGLLIRSFVRLLNADAGFEPSRVLARHLSFRHPHYRESDVATRLDELLERLRSIPGIESVAVTSWLPIDGGRSRFAMAFHIEGRPRVQPGNPEQLTVANMSFVTADYFKTMGIQVLRGRQFTAGDLAPGAAAVKIVSESFVQKFLPGEEPLGKRVAGGEIVGVVKDTRESGLDTRAEPHLYHAGVHTGPLGLRGAALAVRTVPEAPGPANAVEAAVLAWDKNQFSLGVTSLDQILSESVASRRFQMLLTGLFAALALALAAVGIYGVLAYTVSQRTQEIGIRMALGAQPKDAMRLVVGQGMRLALMGVGVGSVGAFAFARVLQTLLFEVNSTDPLTFIGVSLVLLLVSLFAAWIPARRAARVHPNEALRYE
ncbi:MAG: ABC transporter permease [Verrucomicrobiales bacterium]|nr:ABC transporter permease [Verrucomicrobiales bacterium]